MTKPREAPARRPTRAGVSVKSRRLADGSTCFYARITDARGRRTVVPPPSGGQTWLDWGQAFTAACNAQTEAERLSYRSTEGERLLFADLVARHYLPTLSDVAPNTRKHSLAPRRQHWRANPQGALRRAGRPQPASRMSRRSPRQLKRNACPFPQWLAPGSSTASTASTKNDTHHDP